MFYNFDLSHVSCMNSDDLFCLFFFSSFTIVCVQVLWLISLLYANWKNTTAENCDIHGTRTLNTECCCAHFVALIAIYHFVYDCSSFIIIVLLWLVTSFICGNANKLSSLMGDSICAHRDADKIKIKKV